MLEVCFNHGVGGCLKCAQHSDGRGAHVVTVFGWDENGNPPTAEEIEAHRRKIQEEHNKAIAEMIPLGGNGGDVFDFPLAFHMGDISAEIPMKMMRKSHYAIKPHPLKKGLTYCEFVEDELERMLTRAQQGEEIRIWYCSRNPEDVCGLCWFLWILKQRGLRPTVWLMNLPEHIVHPDGVMEVSRGWGEIDPEKYGKYLYLQEKACDGFFTWGSTTWEKLRRENTTLRTVVNGKITSVSEDFYDSLIRMNLEKQAEEFKEPNAIAQMLGDSCLYAVGDEFIHKRLMAMVNSDELEIVAVGEEESYRGKILRKIKK